MVSLAFSSILRFLLFVQCLAGKELHEGFRLSSKRDLQAVSKLAINVSVALDPPGSGTALTNRMTKPGRNEQLTNK